MARRPKKVRISDSDMCRIGTIAHNREFSPRDLSDYLKRDARPVIRRLLREGLIERVRRGAYYPTKKGWRSIEDACEYRR